MPTYYSPSGNPEVWNEKPAGYLTPEEWDAKQAPIREAEAKKAEQERLAAFYADLPTAKATITDKLDSDTSSAILAGFDYSYNGEPLHFSYDTFDQQNFLDTTTACQLAKAGGTGLPTKVTWNAYKPDGTLKQLELDADSFLALYTQGALVHKSTVMAAGGAKKAQVRDAATAEALKSLVAEWGLQV